MIVLIVFVVAAAASEIKMIQPTYESEIKAKHFYVKKLSFDSSANPSPTKHPLLKSFKKKQPPINSLALKKSKNVTKFYRICFVFSF